MRAETLRRKRWKARQGKVCSNAWCRDEPTPGMNTCRRCRAYSREYKRTRRPTGSDGYRRDERGRFA